MSDRPHTAHYVETRTFSNEEDIYSYEKYRESFEKYEQRTTDVAVVETGEASNVKTYIVIPATIFGRGTGPFNQYTMQLPTMIGAALNSGNCIVVGDGKTVWSHVHIQDLANLFLVILRYMSESDRAPSGRKGIYFCESGSHTHLEFSERLAKAGGELGVFTSSEVQRVSIQEAGRQWAFGKSSRAELGFGAKYV